MTPRRKERITSVRFRPVFIRCAICQRQVWQQNTQHLYCSGKCKVEAWRRRQRELGVRDPSARWRPENKTEASRPPR